MEQKGLVKFVRDNWIVLAFLTGLIVSWTNVQNRQANAEVRIGKLENQFQEFNVTLVSLQTSMARVETKVDFIKGKLK